MRSPTAPDPQHAPLPLLLAGALLSILLPSPGEIHAFCARPLPGAPDRLPVTPAGSREVILTFDAAWSARGAEETLEVLSRMDVRATFFLAGRFVERNPELVRRIVERGHEVGNHTWSHRHLTRYALDGSHGTLPGVTREALIGELRATDRALREATGRRPVPIWRAPFGEINGEIRRWTLREGYIHVGWSSGMDTLDWVGDPSSPLYRSPERTVRRILSRLARRDAGSGPAVVLMHLGSTREPTRRFNRALPALIRGCRELGYRLVTVGDTMLGDPLP